MAKRKIPASEVEQAELRKEIQEALDEWRKGKKSMLPVEYESPIDIIT